MAGCIDGRIHCLYIRMESLVGIDRRAERELHAILDLRDITLGDSHECLEFVHLREHHDRLAAVEFPILVVLGRDDA